MTGYSDESSTPGNVNVSRATLTAVQVASLHVV
jgi:hypothetical protein